MRPGLAQRIEAWWNSKPLSSQLVTLITLLLALGLQRLQLAGDAAAALRAYLAG